MITGHPIKYLQVIAFNIYYRFFVNSSRFLIIPVGITGVKILRYIYYLIWDQEDELDRKCQIWDIHSASRNVCFPRSHAGAVFPQHRPGAAHSLSGPVSLCRARIERTRKVKGRSRHTGYPVK